MLTLVFTLLCEIFVFGRMEFDPSLLHSLVRKFLPSHLAQIKYILPEAVQIDKILVHDEKTKCMKVEMNIGLLSDIVKHRDEDESVYVALSTIFSWRLRDFSAKHPEVIVSFLLHNFLVIGK